MFSPIIEGLRDIRNIQKVKTVQMALLAQGYGTRVLAIEKQIEAHVERHSSVNVETIIQSFMEQLERES